MAHTRRKLQSVSTSFFEYDTDILCVNLEGAASIVNHENIHFFQHAGTPYGALMQSLLDEQTLAVDNYIVKCKETFADNLVPVPVTAFHELLNLQRPLPIKPRNNLELIDILPITLRWEQARILEEILEARDITSINPMDATSSIQNAIRYLEEAHNQHLDKDPFIDMNEYLRLGGHLQSFAITASVINNDCNSLCPVAYKRLSDMHVPVGGLAVMEGMALLSERSIFENKVIEDLAGLCLDPTKSIYTCTWEIMFEQYLNIFNLEQENLFHRPDWRSRINTIYNTFLSLSELALFAPVGYIYGCLRRAGNSWSDIHPGYRFIKAVNCLNASDWIESMDPDLCKLLQIQICNRLGWSTPDQFLQIGASLRVRQDSPRYLVRHKYACIERLRNSTYYYVHLPSDFYSKKGCLSLVEKHFAGTISPDESSKLMDFMSLYPSGQLSHREFLDKYGPAFIMLLPTGQMLLNNGSGLFRFFRLALAETVATLGIPNCRDLFPSQLQIECADDFTTFEDLFESYASNCPWHPCRFVEL